MSGSLMVLDGGSGGLFSQFDEGGATSDDLWFVPDDTYYIGYDQDGGVCGRPRQINVTRRIDLGGTANSYNPDLRFLSAGSCLTPTVDAFIIGNFFQNVDSITTPFEIWSDTPFPTFIHSDRVLATTERASAVLIGCQEAVAAAGDINDRCVELIYEDGAGTVPRTMLNSSGAGQWVARGTSSEYPADEVHNVIGYGVVPQTLFHSGTDTTRAGLEILTDPASGLQLPHCLTLWGKRTDAAYGGSGQGGVNAEILADVNKATLDLDHVELMIRWRDNADADTDLYRFKRDQMEIVDGDVAYLLGTDTDGAAAVGARVGSDESFTTDGARLVEWVNDTTVRGYMHHNGDLAMNMLDNGQQLTIETVSEELTILAAATSTSVIQIPINCLVIAVSSYVTVTLPGATVNYDVGVAGAATRYATNVASVVGSDYPGADDGIRHYAANTAILITPDAAPAAATGKIRLTIHYIRIDPATS